MTFQAALRRERIEAPWLLDRPINGERFLIYIEPVLAPTTLKGGVVIIDNPGSHKVTAVRHALRRAGARLALAQILAGPRPDRAALHLNTVTDPECSNYVAHAGYGST